MHTTVQPIWTGERDRERPTKTRKGRPRTLKRKCTEARARRECEQQNRFQPAAGDASRLTASPIDLSQTGSIASQADRPWQGNDPKTAGTCRRDGHSNVVHVSRESPRTSEEDQQLERKRFESAVHLADGTRALQRAPSDGAQTSDGKPIRNGSTSPRSGVTASRSLGSARRRSPEHAEGPATAGMSPL
jgi:hypothetical protein